LSFRANSIKGVAWIIGFVLVTFTIVFYLSFLNRPDLGVVFAGEKNSHNTSIEVTNNGIQPVTNLILTIQAPSKIVKYSIFSTENITLKEIGLQLFKQMQKESLLGMAR
jgi:hypothetical protein